VDAFLDQSRVHRCSWRAGLATDAHGAQGADSFMAMGTPEHPVAKRRGTPCWSISRTLVRVTLCSTSCGSKSASGRRSSSRRNRELPKALVRELLTRETMARARNSPFKKTARASNSRASSLKIRDGVSRVAHGNDSCSSNIVAMHTLLALLALRRPRTTICSSLSWPAT